MLSKALMGGGYSSGRRYKGGHPEVWEPVCPEEKVVPVPLERVKRKEGSPKTTRMTPVRLRCFLPIVILVSTYAHGSGVKTVDPSWGRRSGFLPIVADLNEEAAEESSVEYVENGSDGVSLEPLYDFLIQLRLHKLCKLLREAQLEDILLDTGPLTVFAPTDGSFFFLPGGTLEEIRRNPQWLRDFILHHIVAGDISSQQIQDELVVTSLQGSPLRFNIYGSGQVYTVSGAQILSSDLPFQLGRLHVIDHPLYIFPEGDIVGHLQTTHSQLYRLLLSTGLVEFLSGGTYTIFAPDDSAFGYLSQDFLDILNRNQTLGERILLNHVVHGSIYTRGITNGMQLESVGGDLLTFTESRGLTFVNGIPIVSPDVPVTNGVIHIINRVILPEDIDTDCHCKSSSSGTVSNVPSRTTTGQDQTTGGQFGSRQPQAPGTRVRPQQPQRPIGQVGQPGRQTVGGQVQRPGSHITGTQRESARPGSPHGVSQVRRPGITPERGNIPTSGIQAPGLRPQEPLVTGQVEGENFSQDEGTQQITGDNFVAGQPQAPGSRLGAGQVQRPDSPFGAGHPQTPESTFGTRPAERPGSSFGTGQHQTPGSTFGTGSGQRPGSSFGTEPVQRPGQTQTPGSTFGTGSSRRPGSSFGTGQPQTPGSTFGTGSVQRPGSSFGTGQSHTPGSAPGGDLPRKPGSSFGTGQTQVPGGTFGTGQDQRPGSHVTKGQTQRRGPSQRPGSTPASGYPQRPGSETREPQRPGSSFVTEQPQRPGSSFGTGQPQRPGGSVGAGQPQRPGSSVITGQPQRPGSEIREPQRPGSSFVREQPQRPGSSFGTGQPQRPGGSFGAGQPQRPGSTVITGQPQRDGNVFQPGYPGSTGESERQTPGDTSETGQPQRPGSVSGTDIAPASPEEKPHVPGRTKVNQPGRVPLPPPPTRAPTSHHTPNTRYPGNQQRGTQPTVRPQDEEPQFGGSPGSNVREPYRPTRAPPTSAVSHGTRYPVPGTHSRVTPTRRPHVTAVYPDSPQDSVITAPEVSQPGRTDTRKQPSTQTTQSQYGRHRTPQPVGRITPRPTLLPQTQRPFVGQIRTVPTRAPVSRTTYRPTTNCRQPGDRITSSNRNFPLCSTQDENQGPCQSIDRPYDPSDPRPACPGPDYDQGCRDPLQPPAANDRRPACRIPQRKPDCRKRNERPDNRPLCPDSSRNCRLPEEPEDPSNRLPLCQEIVSVEGCRRPHDPYDPQDRRPECPPDDCRPPQEPLRRGDTRPLCTVNEEDSIRQPLVTTTARPRYPQQPRPGSQPPQTPSDGQSRPGKQPSQGVTTTGGRQQTPSWQRPQTQPHSPRQPTRPEPLTTRKPGKQPGAFDPLISPDDNDALISPVANPPGRPAYPGSSQGSRPQGQPSPDRHEPSSPQSVDRETQSRPGRPQRPPGQSVVPPSIAQSGRPYPGPRQPIVQQPQPPRGSQPSSSPGSPSAAGAGGDDSARSLLDIVQEPGLQIKGHPVKLTIVLDLFRKAGLVNVLEGPGPSTVFLPSDDAFKKLPRGVVEQLGENPDLLRQVLLYHVISQEVRPTAQETSITVPTLQGMSLVITMLKEGRLILIGGAKAVAVTRASNGIFFVINELLYPLPHEDIVSALKSRPDLTQVTSLVQQSGLTNMLTGRNPFTLFAPTDAAFGALPEGTLRELTRNNTAVRELLLGHIVEGAHFGREFLAGGVFPNARGGKLRFKVLSYGYTVNDANIKTPEIVTGTGVIHLVDQVLLDPEDLPSVEEQPQSHPTGGVNVVRGDVAGNYENYPEIAELARGMGLNRFLSWITNTGLIEKVHDGGSYTILAPTDEAVNSLPDNMVQAIDSDPDQVRPLLKFHIITQHIDLNNIRNDQTASTLLPDKRVRFNVYQQEGQGQLVTACGVPISQAQGSGSVRLIPVNQALYPPSGNLAKVLEASPILQNLAKTIRTFHLSWMLNGQGPTTIFAPSDAAFEALSDEDRKNLIENRQAFTDLLKRHIVKGSIFSTGIQDGMQVRNEKRETLTFSVHPGGISVNSIPISYSDVTATNGVLHVIDHFM